MIVLDVDAAGDFRVSSNIGYSNDVLAEQVPILDYLGETVSSLEPDLTVLNNPIMYNLVGLGSKGMSAGATCGASFYWSKNCSNEKCMKPFYNVNYCNTKPCPVCYPRWLEDRTKRLTGRLLSKRAHNRNRGNRFGHIVVSWKVEEVFETLAELKMNVKDALKYLKRKGYKGGSHYFHAFRYNGGVKELAALAGKSPWDWVRCQKNIFDWIHYSPHVHFLGYFGFMRSPKKHEKFIYKTMVDGRGKPVNYLKARDPAAAVADKVRYLLSHTVYLVDSPGGMHSYKFDGNCSYRKFKTSPEEEGLSKMVAVRCPFCGSDVTSPSAARLVYQDMIACGVDPPRFAEELDVVMRDEIPEDAGMWIQKYENEVRI